MDTEGPWLSGNPGVALTNHEHNQNLSEGPLSRRISTLKMAEDSPYIEVMTIFPVAESEVSKHALRIGIPAGAPRSFRMVVGLSHRGSCRRGEPPFKSYQDV